MARPSKYSPDLADRICVAIRAGLTYEEAAAYGGINYRTLLRWRQEKCQFCQAVDRANAEGALRALTIIADAGVKDWRACAWLLEHRFPNDYGRGRRDADVPSAPTRIEIVRVPAEG